MIQTRYLLKAALLLAILIAGSFHVIAQEKKEKIAKLMKVYTDYGQFSGAILVADKGEVIYEKGWGLANIEWNAKNTVDTKFHIGSLTKQFTAMLVMQQVEEGKLDLHKPIATYLPTYPKVNADQLTIHHLLMHSSGIPNYTSFPEYDVYRKMQFTPAKLVNIFADSVLNFTPGEQYEYSNSNYVLLGEILENVTHLTYQDLLQINILAPLGMENTGYEHQGTILAKRANGYLKTISRSRNAEYIDMSVSYAAGGIYSTIGDLHKWDKALYSDKLLSEKYKKLIFTPHISAGGFNHGYGWAMGKVRLGASEESIHIHRVFQSGDKNGFTSLITRFPEDEKSVILVANIATDALEEITQSIINVLYDLPVRLPRKHLASAIDQWLIDHQKPKKEDGLYTKYEAEPSFVPLSE